MIFFIVGVGAHDAPRANGINKHHGYKPRNQINLKPSPWGRL